MKDTHHARAKAKIGKMRVSIDIDVTNGGLLAIGALVSSILLSTAVIVRTARLPSR